MSLSPPIIDLSAIAKPLGWTLAGVCDPQVPDSTQNKFKHWLQDFKGPGMHYLEKRQRERLDPKHYFPEVKSILCFGLYYFQGWATGNIKVSNYAWGRDYHQRLGELLSQTAVALTESMGPFKFKASVDTAPILEKPVAVRAGLGWQAKNTLLINSSHGSYLFLGELLTDISIERFQPSLKVSDHCGTCTRCIDACPTSALTPYALNAEKCIAYWNLEHKGDFNEKTPENFHGWIAGCDICQEVCPWNQKLIPLPKTTEESSVQNIQRRDLDHTNWPIFIEQSAASYMGKQKWLRNLKHLDQRGF